MIKTMKKDQKNKQEINKEVDLKKKKYKIRKWKKQTNVNKSLIMHD